METTTFVRRLRSDSAESGGIGKQAQGIFTAVTCVSFMAGFLITRARTGLMPNEKGIVAVDRLKEQVRRSQLPPPPSGSGKVCWLTPTGVYIGADFIPYSAVIQPSLADNGNSETIFGFRRKLPSIPDTKKVQRLKRIVGLVQGLLILGAAAEIGTAWIGFRQFGLRDDVLCAASAALMLTVLTLALVIAFYSLQWRQYTVFLSLQEQSMDNLRRYIGTYCH